MQRGYGHRVIRQGIGGGETRRFLSNKLMVSLSRKSVIGVKVVTRGYFGHTITTVNRSKVKHKKDRGLVCFLSISLGLLSRLTAFQGQEDIQEKMWALYPTVMLCKLTLLKRICRRRERPSTGRGVIGTAGKERSCAAFYD